MRFLRNDHASRAGHAVQRFGDKLATEETAWTLFALAAAVAGAALAQHALEFGWKKTVGGQPPISPDVEGADWREALIWGVITGAIVGIARVLSLRGARSVRQRFD